METILLNKKNYFINDINNFQYKYHNKFNNLKIIPILGILEKEIGLIKDLSELYDLFYLTYIGPIYSSFLTLNCLNKKDIKNITIYLNESNNEIVLNNIKNTNIKLINDLSDDFISNINNENITNFIYIESNYDINYLIEYMNFINILNDNNKPFILSSENNYFNLLYKHKLKLKNSDKILYICESKFDLFFKNFYYYIESENILNYDNLIHLCIMVKNGGDTFEKVLTENLPYIDKWTILDTGSTDNTIDIINKILVGKKKGQLYQEPFINFKESRNRCLDLAGTSCKYTVMLDDTYILKGNLREFLNTIRGDQFADSYSLLIKSDDVEYYSNRVIKTENKLRYIYIIHEVIQKDDNVNVVIPPDESFIFDVRSDYMEERTNNRKKYDLECLFKMVEEEPDNPRHLYYIGQTYNLLENHEKAAEYFYKRAFHHVEGFDQEKVDALFELTRLYNFKLNKPWDECLSLYNLCYEWDNERPEAPYFIGIHYLLENDEKNAYENFLKAYEIGYPLHRQYSLKPTLSYYYLPINFVPLCYKNKNYTVGEECCKLFLDNVIRIKNQILKNIDNDEQLFNYNYKLINEWYKIFIYLNKMKPLNPSPNIPDNKIIVFVADGGFKKWSGSSILKEGIGGSETYIIEITKYLKKLTNYEIVVFCNCEKEEIFENVKYVHLDRFFEIVSTTEIEHCFINRYSEYIPVAIDGYVNNIHIVLHDLGLTGDIIPINNKIKNIFCLSEWHTESYKKIFPQFQNIISTFHYGIDINNFRKDLVLVNDNITEQVIFNKIPNSFIYSSFPNRGLSILLELWPKIIQKYPNSTLNIFCDLDNQWCLNFHSNEIIKVKNLLNSYNQNELLSKTIINHGWVDKKTLYSYWKKSEFWFYPCIFKETFCLTALEAAISKTFVICNDLAALNNTVNDRGIIINGDEFDVLSDKWQNQALDKLFYYMDNKNEMNYFIEKNYNWALIHSWENRTNELINILGLQKENILISSQEKMNLEYLNMYNWTNDIPEGSKIIFENILDSLKNRKSKILEVGTFVGTSIIHMLNYLPEAIGFTIDRWKNYNESVNNVNYNILSNIEENNTENIYFNNISIYNLSSRITTLKGDSTDMLLFLINNNHFFDFIYVDASHKAFNCYSDLILSWKLLNKNGILGIDDYLYKINENDNLDRPYEAVNHFLEKYKDEYELINKNYRVFIKKII